MVRFADLRRKVLAPLVTESDKPSRYKKEEKKPWILPYYALMSGTQKREQRLKKEKIERAIAQAKKLEAAEIAREELKTGDTVHVSAPILSDIRHFIKVPDVD